MGPDLVPASEPRTLTPERPGLASPTLPAEPERTGRQALSDTLAAAERLAATNPDVAARLGPALLAGDQVHLAQVHPTQIRPHTLTAERTAAALGEVTSRLQSSLTNPVTHSDLRAVEDTLARMPAGGANAVVGRLSDAQLQTWNREIQTGGIGPLSGYSPAEQNRLYGMLAENLDATQLARVTAAMRSGPDDLAPARMGSAIVREASFGVQARFVEAAANGATPGGALGIAGARVVGEQASMNDVHRVISRITPDQMGALVRGSFRSEMQVTVGPNGTAATSIHYDGSHTAVLLRGLAGTGHARMQAAAVDAASAHLQVMEQGAGPFVVSHTRSATNDITGGIRSILDRNAPAVVRELEQERDRSGVRFPAYIEAEIRAGRSEGVGQMLTRIATNNGTTRPGEWISRQEPGDDGRPYHANAQTLGYAVGAVQAAIENRTQRRADQAAVLQNVFNSTVSGIGGVSPAATVVAAGLTGLSSHAVASTLAGFARGDGTLNETLRDLSFPRNAQGRPFNGAAETPFDAALLRVVNSNR